MTDSKEVYLKKIDLLNQYEYKINLLKNITNKILSTYQEQKYVFLPEITILELNLDLVLYKKIQSAVDIESLNDINLLLSNLIQEIETAECKIAYLKTFFAHLEIEFLISSSSTNHLQPSSNIDIPVENTNTHDANDISNISLASSSNKYIPPISLIAEMDIDSALDDSNPVFPKILNKLIQQNDLLSNPEAIMGINAGVKIGTKVSMKVKDKEVLIVIGSTGVGKSTIINYLHGCKMDIEDEVISVAEDSKIKPITTIGHGHQSSTFIPYVISSEESKLNFCDTPGFNDSRGVAINIINTVNIHQILSNAVSVKFLILVSYAEICLDRSIGISSLKSYLFNLFGSEEIFIKNVSSIIIGINKVPKYSKSTIKRLREDMCLPKGNLPEEIKAQIHIIDPLEYRGNREEQRDFWHKLINNSLPIIGYQNTFRPVLVSKDELYLLNISQAIGYDINDLLENNYLDEVKEQISLLSTINIIQHPRVKKIYLNQLSLLYSYIMNLSEKIKNAAELDDHKIIENDLRKVKNLFQLFEKDFPDFKKENVNLDKYLLNIEINKKIQKIILSMKNLFELYRTYSDRITLSLFLMYKRDSKDILSELNSIEDLLAQLNKFSSNPVLGYQATIFVQELSKLYSYLVKLDVEQQNLNFRYTLFTLYNNFIEDIYNDYQVAISTFINRAKIDIISGFKYLFRYVLSAKSTEIILDALKDINNSSGFVDILVVLKKIGWDINNKAARYLHAVILMVSNIFISSYSQGETESIKKLFIDQSSIFKKSLLQKQQYYLSLDNPEIRLKRIQNLRQVKILQKNILKNQKTNKLFTEKFELIASNAYEQLPIKQLSLRSRKKIFMDSQECKKYMKEIVLDSAQQVKKILEAEQNNYDVQIKAIFQQIEDDKNKRNVEKNQILHKKANERKAKNQQLKILLESKIDSLNLKIEQRKKLLSEQKAQATDHSFDNNSDKNIIYNQFFKENNNNKDRLIARLSVLKQIVMNLASKQYSRGKLFQFNNQVADLINFENNLLQNLIEINSSTSLIEKQKKTLANIQHLNIRIEQLISKLSYFVDCYNSLDKTDPADNEIKETEGILQETISAIVDSKTSVFDEAELNEIALLGDPEIQNLLNEKKSFINEIVNINGNEIVVTHAEDTNIILEEQDSFQLKFDIDVDVDNVEYELSELEHDQEINNEINANDGDTEYENNILDQEISQLFEDEAINSQVYDTEVVDESIELEELTTYSSSEPPYLNAFIKYKNILATASSIFTSSNKTNNIPDQFDNEMEDKNNLKIRF